MESSRQTWRSPSPAFLLLVFSCACAASTRAPYDAPVATPPQFGGIAPPVSSFYRQQPSYWRDDLPSTYYQAYQPMATYPRRRPFPHEYPTASYGGHPEYDPYLERAYRRDDGDPYTVLARPWRYHSPYLQTRYFEDLRRPPWRRPTYTFFESAVPAFSGYVGLPARVFYPHVLGGGGDAVAAPRPERRPSFDQYLVFIPLREVMYRPALLGPTAIAGAAEPVHQPDRPGEGVDEAAGIAAVGDHAAPAGGDWNQSHGGDLGSHPSDDKYPLSGEDEVVAQLEEGETSTAAGETTPVKEMDVFTSTGSSTDKPEQSASETEAFTTPQGGQLGEGNGGETPTEEDEHVKVTETPATGHGPEEETETTTESEDMEGETVAVEEDDQDEATTTDAEVDDHESVRDTTTTTPTTTTTKAVYVQMHLLAQDGESTTATPSSTRSQKDGVQAATSESSLIFLGMEMPREEPADSPSQRDRIHKRYSNTNTHARLSLDYKTAHVKPALV